MNATEAMFNNTGAISNEETFMQKFLPAVRKRKNVSLFEEFYLKHFPKLSKYARHSELSEKIVGQAIEKGYRVALATNPIFLKWQQTKDGMGRN